MTIVRFRSPPLSIFLLHEAGSEVDREALDIGQDNNQDPALLEMLTSKESRDITVARQVVVKEMCEAPALIFTQQECITTVVTYGNVTKNHECKTAKTIVDLYEGSFILHQHI